ncbi:MAG TPA: extracellular solute-binding protein, partial [Acidimicrobiales bacterium]
MKRLLAVALAVGLGLAACGDDGSSHGPVTLTLVTHDSFAVTESVLASFTAETGIKVQIAKGADAGTVVNRAVLTAGKPEGDVLWGVDNTLISRADKGKVFAPYQSEDLPADVRALDPTGTVTPVDTGDVCVNYDKAWFASKGIAPPDSLADL